MRAIDIPDLATATPLWLALLTIFVNALVGASRAHQDTTRAWDIVGMTVFALLMGLGGGFIRDTLIGNLPAESLRTPWAVATALAATLLVVAIGPRLSDWHVIMRPLNAVAMGLFSVTGAAYALDAQLPVTSAVLVGTASAVGGGVLVSLLQGQVPDILVASAPSALLAALGAFTFVALDPLSSVAASLCGIGIVLAAQYLVDWRQIRTRPAALGTFTASYRRSSVDGSGRRPHQPSHPRQNQ